MTYFTAGKLSLLLVLLTTANGENITTILESHDSLSYFSHFLSLTEVDIAIDQLENITVCVVNNEGMQDLVAKDLPISTLKKVISLHILLNYLGPVELQQIPNGTFMVDTYGSPSGRVNVTDIGDQVTFRVESEEAIFLKFVEFIPSRLSVIEISQMLSSPEVETVPVPETAPEKSKNRGGGRASSVVGPFVWILISLLLLI